MFFYNDKDEYKKDYKKFIKIAAIITAILAVANFAMIGWMAYAL